MEKKYKFLLIGLIFVNGLPAQDIKKDWAEGKLTWNDFSERNYEQGVSELNYFLGFETGKQKFGDTIVVRNFAQAYIYKDLSWINPKFKTAQYLRYNQVIFDIIEIHRRRLQIELDRMGSFESIYYSCDNEIERFYKESNGGSNLGSIIFWEQKMSDELDFFKEEPIPKFENRSFGYAMHAGLGAGYFTSSLGEHFSSTINLIYGFDVAYKQSIFYINATLAAGNVTKDYSFSDEIWNKKKRAGLAVLDVSYGYAFIDNRKLKLAPFLGLGITELSLFSPDYMDENDDENTGYRFVDYNVIFGLNADYKLRTKINLAQSWIMNEKVETSIRARLYIAKANYAPDLKGYSLNLTIGICGFGNMIRLK